MQKILPDPEPSLWVNLNRDEFCSLPGPAARWAGQSHLIGEFRDLAGLTPAGYLRSRIDGPNHVQVSPPG